MKFWDSVNIVLDTGGTPNTQKCWEWKSKIGTGERGYTKHNGKSWSTSRLAWFLVFGEIPKDLCVCHKCDNPPCCNPYHLFLGTVQDNVDDREMKGRNKMPLSRGEAHGLHKLTERQVVQIRARYNQSHGSYRSLAQEFGVSFGEIRKIIKGQTWGWL